MPSSKASAINLRWLAIYSSQENQLQTRFLGPVNQDTLSSASFMNRTSSTRLEMIFTLTSRINLRPLLYMKPLGEFPRNDLTFNLHLHGNSRGLLTPDRQARQGPHVCAQKSCPRGDQHLRVRGSVRGYGVFLTPVATHASQQDTVTRQ